MGPLRSPLPFVVPLTRARSRRPDSASAAAAPKTPRQKQCTSYRYRFDNNDGGGNGLTLSRVGYELDHCVAVPPPGSPIPVAGPSSESICASPEALRKNPPLLKPRLRQDNPGILSHVGLDAAGERVTAKCGSPVSPDPGHQKTGEIWSARPSLRRPPVPPTPPSAYPRLRTAAGRAFG